MSRNRTGKNSFICGLALLCLGGAACIYRPVAPDPGQSELFWPAPPEAKRIAFLRTVSEPGDLDIRPGLLRKMFRYIGGIPETALVSPYGIALGPEERLYVVDTFLHRVHVFDRRGNHHSVFPSDDTLPSPVGIAIDTGSGLIFVTDSKLGVVKVFADGGRRWVSDLGEGLFKRPTGIAVNRASSELVVVDTLQARVFRFDLPGLVLTGSFGGSGGTDGRFHYPTQLCVDPDGRLIVSDTLNFRVQVFSPTGEFLFKIGGAGNTPGSFSRPKGVAADSDGNIYVTDALFDNVQMFDNRGRLLMDFGGHGSTAGAFSLSTGMCIDAHDVIYVADAGNHRLQMFQYLKEENGER